jgi:hypothetical protein
MDYWRTDIQSLPGAGILDASLIAITAESIKQTRTLHLPVVLDHNPK